MWDPKTSRKWTNPDRSTVVNLSLIFWDQLKVHLQIGWAIQQSPWLEKNMWKVSANDVIFHGCFWVPVPVPSTCWLRQSLLCGSWCRMCVRHLQLVYNWIVGTDNQEKQDVAHICCLGTIRRNKKHLGLLFGLLLAIRLSNLQWKHICGLSVHLSYQGCSAAGLYEVPPYWLSRLANPFLNMIIILSR